MRLEHKENQKHIHSVKDCSALQWQEQFAFTYTHTHKITCLQQVAPMEFASGDAAGQLCFWEVDLKEPTKKLALKGGEVRAIQVISNYLIVILSAFEHSSAMYLFTYDQQRRELVETCSVED